MDTTITLIHLSDIHYRKSAKPENQGLVLNEFIKDLQSQIKELNLQKTYLIISGDIVYEGDNTTDYDDFYQNFLKKLYTDCGLTQENTLFVAGNHDISRQYIQNNRYHIPTPTHFKLEEEFNDYMDTGNNNIRKKFLNFNDFCEKTIKIRNFDCRSYIKDVTKNLSICCVNSALCCGESSLEDKEKLFIYTREIYKYAQDNPEKQLILVMHHPVEYLNQQMQSALGKILEKNNFILVLTGHLHRQNTKGYVREQQKGNNKLLIYSHVPHLNKNKQEKLGYSIITLKNLDNISEVESISVRHWDFDDNIFYCTSPRKFINTKVQEIVKIDMNKKSKTFITEKEMKKPYNKLKEEFENIKPPIIDSVYVDCLIKELKNIAKEKEELRQEIFNLFCDYIRKRTAYKDPYLEEKCWKSLNYKDKINEAPFYDVQLIFSILYGECKDIFENFKGNFRSLVLNNIYFVGLNISNADFSNSFLEHANMFSNEEHKTTFEDCFFDGAYVDAANMSASKFINVSFKGANMRWTNVWGCELINVDFSASNMTFAILSETKIKECIFDYCILDASELNDLHFLTKIKFYHVSFCFASIFCKAMLDTSKVEFKDCITAGAESNFDYFEDKFGRIGRLMKYKKNIEKENNILNTSKLSHNIDYKKMKYKNIINIFRDYYAPNMKNEAEALKSIFDNEEYLKIDD